MATACRRVTSRCSSICISPGGSTSTASSARRSASNRSRTPSRACSAARSCVPSSCCNCGHSGDAARHAVLLLRLSPVGELVPALLLQVHAELLRRRLNAPPGLVAFGVRDTLDLIETRHGAADVAGVDQGLLALPGERELAVIELVLL